ncbi:MULTISPECIES: hypothetical protein [Bacillus cereus group]|uniref:hypothetical protein n=1 Tax=Bacillus cereus group TaxID=86661 RepID=UPI001F5B88F4|nr:MULTISPECIES: hypothetical protein [Bacillus cereus group]
MQIRNFFLVFIVICLFEVAGCSNNIGNDEQTVEVQKRVGDNIYEDLNVVTDNNEVLQVKKILKDTHFENKKVGSFVKEPAFVEFCLVYEIRVLLVLPHRHQANRCNHLQLSL